MASRSRIAEVYVQVVPVLAGFQQQLSQTISEGVQDASSSSETASSSQTLGENIGETAGPAASRSLGTALMTGLAALGLGAIVAKNIQEGLDQIDINNKLTAALNLNASEQKNITEAASNLYSEAYGESYEAVSETMRNIVSSITDAKDASAEQLEEMGKVVLNLESVYGLSGEDITRAMQNIVSTGFASTWKDAASIILSGYQTMGSAGEDWIETLQEFSDDFKKLGFTGSEAINLVNAGLEAGIFNTEKMGEALNEVSIRLADGTADEALTALGFNPDEIKASISEGGDAAQEALISVLQKLQDSGNIVQWQAVLGTFYEDFQSTFENLDLSSLNSSLEEGIGDLEKFNSTVKDGANSSLTTFQRTISQTFSSLLIPVLEAITPPLQAMATFLSENETAAAALGWVLAGVLVAGVVLLTASLWGMAAAGFAAIAPFLPLIAAIAAVVAVGVAAFSLTTLIIDNWDAVSAFIMDSLQNIANFFVDIGQSIATFWANIGKSIGNVFIFIANSFINYINTIISALNSISVDLPDFLGGGHFGFSIPLLQNIAYLADGGTIPAKTGGTLAVLGEAGKDEVVMDAGKWNDLIDYILSPSNSTSGETTTQTFNIYQQAGESTEELVERIANYNAFTSLKPATSSF